MQLNVKFGLNDQIKCKSVGPYISIGMKMCKTIFSNFCIQRLKKYFGLHAHCPEDKDKRNWKGTFVSTSHINCVRVKTSMQVEQERAGTLTESQMRNLMPVSNLSHQCSNVSVKLA